MKNLRIESLILALSVVALGLCLNLAIGKATDVKRTVAVRGLSEKQVKADKVTWPMKFQEMGNDLAEMYDRIDENNRQVVEFLVSKGISENEISIGAPELTDRMADRYRDDSRVITSRYYISYIITVSTNKVNLVRELIAAQGELLKQGIAVVSGDWEHQTKYEFTGLNDIKPGMIEEATKNARMAAEKFASDSESKLGKIVEASQGQFSIEDRDQNTPYIKNVRIVTYVTYQLKD